MTVALILVALAFGYGLGRWQPWRRLARWADRRVRDDGRWWLTTPLAAAAFVATGPRGSLYAWRHRNDPPTA
ncbi:hypothetical protein [Streptomyces sp. 4R-3d]|uniref:hypothetical protein n=1 Tax=Streptomyces sp. 4R-3d TaxID=2559605 RepID=UPI0010725C43|nr:hypothetical protein [Streptomyces sp. 4R-3d]TFI30115.1 hypothetical protein E4P36_05030 [Streptomyces sp. 4R-3d]